MQYGNLTFNESEDGSLFARFGQYRFVVKFSPNTQYDENPYFAYLEMINPFTTLTSYLNGENLATIEDAKQWCYQQLQKMEKYKWHKLSQNREFYD